MRNPLNSNEVSGNVMAYMADQAREVKDCHCSICDSETAGEHICGNCGDIYEADQEICQSRGQCSDCYYNGLYAEKFGGI